MSENYYALIKKERVDNVIVVDEQDDASIKTFCADNGFDEAVFLGTSTVALHSLKTKDGFIAPDYEYLKSIGLAAYSETDTANK